MVQIMWNRMPRAAPLAAVLCVAILSGDACVRRSTLPAALSDREWWDLIEALSEPAGAFTLSDNVVSNEPHFAETARWLRPSGGVYIGVGPEQNFSYIAGLRPAMAFIIDIRRENLDLHLLYKALFELSVDRADFVSRLFSRPRPEGLRSSAAVDEIFEKYGGVAASPELYGLNLTLIRERLLTSRGLPLTQTDLDWIERAFNAFYVNGPKIDYYGSRTAEAVRPSYRQLMTAKDLTGQSRSFLASEEAFQFVKELQSQNRIVLVIGDFGGPDAIRRVGDYVRKHSDRVYAVYGSNVGVYLNNQQTRAFCRNLATLPATTRSWFIDSRGMRTFEAKLKACLSETAPAAQQ
jgi:hypothetical protein